MILGHHVNYTIIPSIFSKCGISFFEHLSFARISPEIHQGIKVL